MSWLTDILTGSSSSTTDQSSAYQADPRKFTVQHCDAKAEERRRLLEDSKHVGLISGLEKVAGIEGTGVIQEALDAIVSATHVGGSEWERLVDGGVEGILTMLMGDQATNLVTGAMNKISPHATNSAVATAEALYDKIKSQDLDWRDLPQYTADFKHLYELGASIIDPFTSNNATSSEPTIACSASPYATDLINIGAKFKFLFVVEIKFYKEYQNLVKIDPAFVVKTADRPKVSYEYEEINMYNFRTKVVKRSAFAPLEMTFYDDEQNRATAFYNAMFRLMSPVGNQYNPDLMEQNGMNYSGLQDVPSGTDAPTQGITVYADASASVGPLLGSRTSIIEYIDMYHVYMSGQKINRYRFYRPRIVNMSLDNLDMTSEAVTELHLEFCYDAVEIINHDDGANVGQVDQRDGITYPLGGNGTSNVSSSSSVSSGTTASSDLAELYAKGEAYIEGVKSTASNAASSIYDSVASSVSGIFS